MWPPSTTHTCKTQLFNGKHLKILSIPSKVSVGSFHFLLVIHKGIKQQEGKGCKEKCHTGNKVRVSFIAWDLLVRSHAELCAQGACTWSFHGILLFETKQIMDKLWSFSLGYLADIFLKMNKLSLSPQDKQLLVLCPWYNFSFQVKIRLLENLYPASEAWQLPNNWGLFKWDW